MGAPALIIPVGKALLVAKGCWILYRAYPALYNDAYAAYGLSKRTLAIGKLAQRSRHCHSVADVVSFAQNVSDLQEHIRTDGTTVERKLAVADLLNELVTGAFRALGRWYVLRDTLDTIDMSAADDLYFTYLGLYLYGYCGNRIEAPHERTRAAMKLISLHDMLWTDTPPQPDGDHQVKQVLQTLQPHNTTELRNALEQHAISGDLVDLTGDEQAIEVVLYTLGMQDIAQRSPAAHPGTVLAEHYRNNPVPTYPAQD